VDAAVWLIALTIPALALAFLVGLFQWRLFAAQALSRLGACLDAVPDPPTLRRAFADAFADPSVELVFPVPNRPGRWIDPNGLPVVTPEPGGGRTLSEVRGSNGVIAGLIHDGALDAYPELLHAGTAMAGVALDNQRLTAQARTTMRELRESRARIATSAERERRRIERDLHDGAQQQLVALRIELGLAEDLVRRDPELGASRLVLLEQRLDEALEDLRSLAHGVYPSLLADRGLAEALRTVAVRSAIRTDLVAHDVGRYSPEVESAVYFCVREALQNALKHGAGAQRITLELDGSVHGELWFSVRDDGAGAPDGVVVQGSGVTNMRDRMGAVNGELHIGSEPCEGTTVRGRVPAVALRLS
jgi:signal transduction histidine kinase